MKKQHPKQQFPSFPFGTWWAPDWMLDLAGEKGNVKPVSLFNPYQWAKTHDPSERMAAAFSMTHERWTYLINPEEEAEDNFDSNDAFCGWITYRTDEQGDVEQWLDQLFQWIESIPEVFNAKAETFIQVTGHSWGEQPREAEKTIRVSDLLLLEQMLQEAESAIGRDIVHGDANRDTPDDITQNVVATVRQTVIRRWAAQCFPHVFTDWHHPDDPKHGFPDDDEYQKLYEEYGFEKN